MSLDEATMIPQMIHLTPAKVSDRRGTDNFRYPTGTGAILISGCLRPASKTKTVYKSIGELDLPEGEEEHILKNELIYLTGQAAKKAGIDSVQLRRVAIYKAEENKVIEVIINNLDWSAATIGELYKRGWQIEIFLRIDYLN